MNQWLESIGTWGDENLSHETKNKTTYQIFEKHLLKHYSGMIIQVSYFRNQWQKNHSLMQHLIQEKISVGVSNPFEKLLVKMGSPPNRDKNKKKWELPPPRLSNRTNATKLEQYAPSRARDHMVSRNQLKWSSLRRTPIVFKGHFNFETHSYIHPHILYMCIPLTYIYKYIYILKCVSLIYVY